MRYYVERTTFGLHPASRKLLPYEILLVYGLASLFLDLQWSPIVFFQMLPKDAYLNSLPKMELCCR